MNNIFYRIGILVGLFVLTVVNTSAASACPAQPTNPDGTTITSPSPDQVITSPFTIQGMYYGSFEGVVPIQLLDASGAEIVHVNAMNECCVLSPYQQQITFTVSAPTPACLVVSRENGKDGSLTPLAQIPITLSPVAGMPGTGDAPMPSLPLLLLVALSLVGAGLLLRRRTRLG
jgi:LPXTG-motif cell wall-anchored protein